MTTFWPKRDEEGRHVTATGERYIIGECGGPELKKGDVVKFKATYENTGNTKPLSELLAKLDPDVIDQARADVADGLKCAKCDGLEIIALGGEIYNCECKE